MARINLLTLARGAARRAQAAFLSILGLVGRGCGAAAARRPLVNAQIDGQKARNDYITANIRELDKQVEEIKDLQRKRNQLIERMRVIQELQGNRPIIVRVLDQLVRTVPDGVFYTRSLRPGPAYRVSRAWRSPTTASPA
jgi:type IV pilus assembly protein PilN